MRNATLCLIIRNNQILLGKKKRGFGEGKYNGFGGKFDPTQDKTIEDAAIRELGDESGILVDLENLIKVGEIEFYFPELKAEKWNQKVHIYQISEYSGTPSESEEMTVEWFDINKMPYKNMWETDTHWLPFVLSGKLIRAKFYFNEDCETTKSFDIQEVSGFS